jgi:LacI family transcriptional regulator
MTDETDDPKRAPKLSAAALARSLGVSPAAVSYALHGLPGVSDETRERILKAAAEGGLHVQPQELAAHRPVLGLALADVGNPFYSELAISVTDAARAEGFEVFISSTNDQQAAFEASVSTMVEHRVDGALLTAMDSRNASVCRTLNAARIPFVQLSRRMEGVKADFVGIDDFAAGKAITNHMLGHGYRRLALVTGLTTSSASNRRAAGFRAALDEAGVELSRPWNVRGGLNESDGVRAAEHLLGQPELPQAIVCGTDAIALGVLSVFNQRGMSVPGDVAVSGFDGLTSSRTSLVGLTTVIQPRHSMAAEAVRLLVRRMKTPSAPPQSVECLYQLFIGRTCGCATEIEKKHV